MAWITKCECPKMIHHGGDGCPGEPMYLVRVEVEDRWNHNRTKEVIRAVCSNCHFTDTPILGRYGI